MKLRFIALSLIALFSFQCGSGDVEFTGKTPEAGEVPSDAIHSGAKAGNLTYTAPEMWTKTPPANSMRIDQYVLPAMHGGQSGEMVVSFFPGEGGPVQMNLERWYGQFDMPDGSLPKDHAITEEKTINGLKVTIVYLNGTFMKGSGGMGGTVVKMEDYMLMAAIVETPAGPWFFKGTGPAGTMNVYKESFLDLVDTFKIAE